MKKIKKAEINKIFRIFFYISIIIAVYFIGQVHGMLSYELARQTYIDCNNTIVDNACSKDEDPNYCIVFENFFFESAQCININKSYAEPGEMLATNSMSLLFTGSIVKVKEVKKNKEDEFYWE